MGKFFDPDDNEGLPKWLIKVKNFFLPILGVIIFVSVFAIPIFIIIAMNECSGPSAEHFEITGDIATILQVVGCIVVIGLVGLIWYGCFKFIRREEYSKARNITNATLLTILIVGLIALFLYFCSFFEYFGPRVNDAHFDKI